MKPLKTSERKELKSRAHHLKPVIMIGQKGLTDSLINAVEKALCDHELIKIKFIDFKKNKKDLSDEIAERTDSTIVGIIGNILILYRENPETAETQ
jgi:RNA-binding protein